MVDAETMQQRRVVCSAVTASANRLFHNHELELIGRCNRAMEHFTVLPASSEGAKIGGDPMSKHATVLMLGLALSASLIVPALGQSETSPIGKVVKVSGAVTVEHTGAVVVQASTDGGRIKLGDPVYKGDIVQTGADGAIGVTFSDGTAFNLTSNARMVLNEFVYDPNGKSNSTFFSLTKGTFTFVAGKVAKTGDMKIDTPVATMGIRGTTPHIEISDNGTVKFSTLVEEGRSKVEKRATLPRQGEKSPQQRQVIDKPNLTICRGC